MAVAPSTQHADHEGDLQPLRDVLGAVARELERARSLGLRVEQTICAVATRAHLDVSTVQELQQLDAVLQQIAALRDFVSTLTGVASTERIATRQALESVTLGDTRARLSGVLDEDDENSWEFL